jgi:hypothetical protein
VRVLLLRAHVWLGAGLIPLLVRALPLRCVLRLLTPPRWCHAYRGIDSRQICQIVHRRLENPIRMRGRVCLRTGLTLFHFLRLAALPAELHFGVFPPAPATARLHAHCWVTLDGVPLTAPPEGNCAEVMIHPRKGQA